MPSKKMNKEDVIIDLSFMKAPYEEIFLPSKGYFYGNTIPEITNGTVHIRKMKGADERLLSGLNRNTFYTKWRDVLRNCLQEKFDIYELTALDFFYLMFIIRGLSYGSKYEIETTCPECGSQQTLSVDIANFIPTEINEPVVEPFDFTLFDDNNGHKITAKLHYPRLKDIIESMRKKGPNFFKSNLKVSEGIYQKFLCTDEITIPQGDEMITLRPGENPEHDKVILDIYNNIDPGTIGAITQLFDKYDHGFIEPQIANCSECGGEIEVYPAVGGRFLRESESTTN